VDLTVERVRELCAYNPSTGALTWRVSKGAAKAGSPVGGTHRVKGYGEACIDGNYVQTHRLIWFYIYGEWPKGEIDHRNGIADDNSQSNLRDVPIHVNRQNVRKATNKKPGGLLGAHKTRSGKWQAAICVKRKQIHLGLFPTPEAAHAAYLTAKRSMHEGCTI